MSNESSKIDNILHHYSDRDRLTTIGRLYKDGHISEDEFVNLLTGDRNYFLTETIEEIKRVLPRQQYPFWSSTFPATTGGYVYTTGTGLSGGSVYTNAATNP